MQKSSIIEKDYVILLFAFMQINRADDVVYIQMGLAQRGKGYADEDSRFL